VRILVARCEIAYHGRATTRLGAGDRVILFKDDGSLCVHAEKGYKPLNYTSIKARDCELRSLVSRG
jgi:RecB family endonuclease NucS